MYRVGASDVDLLGDLNGVVDLDAEVGDGALDLRMAEQKSIDLCLLPGK